MALTKNSYKEIKNGNVHKKEELLRKLKPLIIKSIRKYYNDFSQFEDLIQQGYEVILKGINEFDEKKDVNFLGFIKMKLKFYYLDKHKYRKEKPSSLNNPIGEDGDEILDLIPDMDKSPLDKVLEKERKARLRKAMKVLTQRQRKIIIYYYMKNKSIKEISHILKISYRTVINTKTTALKKLRKQMEN